MPVSAGATKHPCRLGGPAGAGTCALDYFSTAQGSRIGGHCANLTTDTGLHQGGEA